MPARRCRKRTPTHATVVFFFDLDNNTDTDYQFAKGPGTVVMTRLKSNGSLSSEQPIELNNSVFLAGAQSHAHRSAGDASFQLAFRPARGDRLVR